MTRVTGVQRHCSAYTVHVRRLIVMNCVQAWATQPVLVPPSLQKRLESFRVFNAADQEVLQGVLDVVGWVMMYAPVEYTICCS